MTLEREDISGCLELKCCLDRETAPAPVTVVLLSPHLEDIVHIITKQTVPHKTVECETIPSPVAVIVSTLLGRKLDIINSKGQLNVHYGWTRSLVVGGPSWWLNPSRDLLLHELLAESSPMSDGSDEELPEGATPVAHGSSELPPRSGSRRELVGQCQ